MRRIIAVSGPPGAGKSTLATALSGALNAPIIAFDDHETMTAVPEPQMLDWLDRGCPFDEIDTPGLPERLAAITGTAIFETPLGRCHSQTGGFVDLSIWLECPLDLALARKITAMISGGADPGMIGHFIGVYPRLARPALLAQAERIPATADIVLDATLLPERLLESALSAAS